MTVADLTNEIYLELGSPSDVSTSSISFWIRSNVGTLNNHINTKFVVDTSTLEINYLDDKNNQVELKIEEASIFKKMYFVYDYDKKLRALTGSASWDSVLEINDAGTTIRKVNKSEISKTLVQAKKEEVLQLNNLINSYKLKKSNPRQVAGDDTIEGVYPHDLEIRHLHL